MGTEAALFVMGSMITAGASIANTQAQKREARRAREAARQRYMDEQRRIKEQTLRLETIDEEKKRKMAASKSQVPESVLTGGSFTGIQDPATTQRAKLLGQ